MSLIRPPVVTARVASALREVVYEPGNGTSYRAVGVRVRGALAVGELGSVEDGWLVALSPSRRAHLFQPTGFLAQEYVAEKFGLHAPPDVAAAAIAIAALLSRDTDATPAEAME